MDLNGNWTRQGTRVRIFTKDRSAPRLGGVSILIDMSAYGRQTAGSVVDLSTITVTPNR